jgi:hypothetical protein
MVESTESPSALAHSLRPRIRLRRLTLLLAGFVAGAAVAVPLTAATMSSARPVRIPTRIDRAWSTSQVARYLGLSDTSSFGSGIACQLYVQKKRPYDWVVSLCHR